MKDLVIHYLMIGTRQRFLTSALVTGNNCDSTFVQMATVLLRTVSEVTTVLGSIKLLLQLAE